MCAVNFMCGCRYDADDADKISGVARIFVDPNMGDDVLPAHVQHKCGLSCTRHGVLGDVMCHQILCMVQKAANDRPSMADVVSAIEKHPSLCDGEARFHQLEELINSDVRSFLSLMSCHVGDELYKRVHAAVRLLPSRFQKCDGNVNVPE